MTSKIREWFDSIDGNRSGSVECHELQQALAKGNLHFSLSTVSHMIRLHEIPDVNRSDRTPRLNFTEFQLLHKFLEDTQRIFSDASPADGYITPNQLATVLKGAGYSMPQKVFDRIFIVFDPEGMGRIDLTGFIRVMMFFRSSRAAFIAFDPRQVGHITLKFDQFLYALSNVV